MFGDPRAGYTIAFIFRIPDPCARGRRRQYAFMCLCRGGERKAVRAFGMLTQVFREWAGWVTGLAEGEAVRVEGELASGGSGGAQGGQWAGGGSGYAAGLQNARANSVNEGRPGQGAFGGAGGFGGAPNTSNSSFLSGRMGAPGSQWEEARMGGLGVGRIRSRGLAELVGLPDFFLLLHVKFVELLARLRVLMEGG